MRHAIVQLLVGLADEHAERVDGVVRRKLTAEPYSDDDAECIIADLYADRGGWSPPIDRVLIAAVNDDRLWRILESAREHRRPERRRALIASAIVRGVKAACTSSGNEWGIVDALDEWARDAGDDRTVDEALRSAAGDVWWHFGHAGDSDASNSNFADGRSDRDSATAAERIACRGRNWLRAFGAQNLHACDLVAP